MQPVSAARAPSSSAQSARRTLVGIACASVARASITALGVRNQGKSHRLGLHHGEGSESSHAPHLQTLKAASFKLHYPPPSQVRHFLLRFPRLSLPTPPPREPLSNFSLDLPTPRYGIFCFDQLYIKFAVDGTAVDSNWGRVFYTNLWASLLAGAITVATEPHTLRTVQWTPYSLGAQRRIPAACRHHPSSPRACGNPMRTAPASPTACGRLPTS
jgi:hypothetical protein